MSDRDSGDAVAADPRPPPDEAVPGAVAPNTVGTGSAIGIGCVVLLVVVVVVALVLRWFTGVW